MKSRQASLILVLLGAVWAGAAPPEEKPRFGALSNEDAWKRLPRQEPPLPAWARVLAESLPRTTALMLELDHVHRAQNPLGPVLSGKLRWVAADANRCDYAKRYAEADLRKAGLKDGDLKKLAGDHRDLPEPERAALAFARKLSLAAHTVSDDEVFALLRHFGPERTTAIVHTLAHANFQHRVFLALGVAVEPGGPLPPLETRFDQKGKPKVPPRPPWEQARAAKAVSSDLRPDWLQRNLADVRKAVEGQKERSSRIPVPGPERLEKLPPEVKARYSRIVWSTVSMGYQPLLTKAWFDCMSAFQQEATLDRVFSNTVFWVITRSNECFY
jgi:alkylhydroperoxidase family enzyme